MALVRRARLLAEALQADPSVTAESYLAPAHLAAIYVPAWAPLLMPLLLAVVKGFQELRAKRKKQTSPSAPAVNEFDYKRYTLADGKTPLIIRAVRPGDNAALLRIYIAGQVSTSRCDKTNQPRYRVVYICSVSTAQRRHWRAHTSGGCCTRARPVTWETRTPRTARALARRGRASGLLPCRRQRWQGSGRAVSASCQRQRWRHCIRVLPPAPPQPPLGHQTRPPQLCRPCQLPARQILRPV
jgi:hypothetical protein